MKTAQQQRMKLKFTGLFFLLLNLLTLNAAAQDAGKKKIELIRADYQDFSVDIHPDATRLLGNVIMRHEGVMMYCDSAYLYDKSNSLDAFSRVKINQGDTLLLNGDLLKYKAATKTAEVFNNIRMTDREMVLTTDYLIHNLSTGVSTYLNGGKIVSTENDNVLTSQRGEYYSEGRWLFFKTNVVLVNARYTIRTDSLRFNIETEVAHFIGPTEIESKDSFIYCENGWSDTRRNISQFNKNAYIISDTQRMQGDSLYYDQNSGLGEAFYNVQITDTVNDYVINGDYAIHFDSLGESLVTGNALLTLIEDTDSLFLHGDTLFSIKDSAGNNLVHAYHRVKFFRNDLQGKCDSLTYSDTDSTIIMYYEPILWSDENQINGDVIELYLKKGGLDKMYIDENAFITSEASSVQFNQIKGNNLTGYFEEGKLYKVNIEGNGETIYYAKEESADGAEDKDIGMNRLICSDIIILLDNNEVQRIIFIDQPSGTMFPIEQVPGGKDKLEGFRWDPGFRPMEMQDIFIKDLPEVLPVADDALPE
jgi:lipopolysaccharide export system protein LptA